MQTIRSIYAEPAVRRRIEEFIGLTPDREPEALFLSTSVDPMNSGFIRKTPRELDFFLSAGLDLARSLWDRTGLIAHLDIEYVNFDFESEPYLDPQRTYGLQEPVRREIEALLGGFGIRPLVCLSGRGYHWAWKIPHSSPVFEDLASVNHLPGELLQYYRCKRLADGTTVDPAMARAFAGLGKVMEYLVLQVIKRSRRSRLPVLISAVLVPPQQRGREMISLDITEYGDPLNTRTIRIPFSVYLKPWRSPHLHEEVFQSRYPLIFLIPTDGMDYREAMEAMRDPDSIIALARRTRMAIPEQAEGSARLLEAYGRSDLRRFHEWFYSSEHDRPEDWPRTYDRTPLGELPACIRRCLEHPNDLLLKPAVIRQIVLVLLVRGWHPRHIAGLIRSKYERNWGWGSQWYIYNAALRADFYVRVFAGAMETGTDRLDDLTCVLKKENCRDCEEVYHYRDLLLNQVKT